MNWSYISGFFDGEGNLQVSKIIKKQSNSFSYQVMVRMYNTNKQVLYDIQEFLGFGTIYFKESTKVYELTITKKSEVINFLKGIMNESIIKNNQILYLLDNFDFSEGMNNNEFNLDRFRSFITRQGVKRVHTNNISHLPINIDENSSDNRKSHEEQEELSNNHIGLTNN